MTGTSLDQDRDLLRRSSVNRRQQHPMMALVLRIVAATAAMSVVFTIWLILVIVTAGGFRPLLGAGALGVLTLMGWAVTLSLGPVTAVQLWRLKESGRRAGLVLFGFGAVYYLSGFVWLRAPGAQSSQIVMAVIAYALPFAVLALPSARHACRVAEGPSTQTS